MKKLFFLVMMACMAIWTNPARAGDTISVSGSSIKITGSVTPTYISANSLNISYTAPNVILRNATLTYIISYSRVAVPAHTNVTKLLFKIDSMANIARGGIAGDASAANQLLQITSLQTIRTKTGHLDSGWVFVHKAALDSTRFKASAGVLHTLTINSAGASANQIKIWDGTTLIAVIDGTATKTFTFDAIFATDLRVKCVTGTAPDYTVTYR